MVIIDFYRHQEHHVRSKLLIDSQQNKTISYYRREWFLVVYVSFQKHFIFAKQL